MGRRARRQVMRAFPSDRPTPPSCEKEGSSENRIGGTTVAAGSATGVWRDGSGDRPAGACGFVNEGHEVELFTTGDSDCPVPRAWVLSAAATEAMGDAVVEIHHVTSA